MDYNELINYCMQDAMLTYELTTFDDELVMNLITLIARISRMSIEECSRRAVGAWIGQYLFNAHRKMNYLIPRVEDILRVKGKPATKSKVKGKQYEGALVVKPKAGIPFKMKGLDFGSLYPSVKKNYNIGYATINCPHPNCIDNKFADLPHHICKKNRAIESIFVGALRDLRLNYYKKQSKNKELTQSQRNTYKAIEQVIKVIVNGDYGVSASESFAFYCPVASEEIAGISRSVTMQTIEHAKELGINIHYGDTDSLFISDTNPEIIKSLQNWAFSKFGIELEEDKVFKFMGFSTRKKNYFGVKENGDIDIKGLTGGKKHVPNFYKLYYSRIIKEIQKIQTEDDIPNAKNQISAIIKEGYNNLKKRKWGELSELAFHITSSKMPEEYKKGVPQHVKAVKQLIESGYQYELGTEISIIKTLKNKNRESVMPLQLAKPVHVNVDAYIKQFESMVSQIIDIFGIKWDDILGTTKMTSYLYD
jgi:DNA polymerase I